MRDLGNFCEHKGPSNGEAKGNKFENEMGTGDVIVIDYNDLGVPKLGPPLGGPSLYKELLNTIFGGRLGSPYLGKLPIAELHPPILQ